MSGGGGLETRTSVRRLVQDIKEIVLDRSLDGHGIYYEHNMENYMEGHAMVIGPRDTPYEDSFFFFRFEFPANYPYAPPKVTLLNQTRDKVRLNPNLYVEGKVCLSILNTWQGEPWSACQTIRSVLLTLVTVLNEKPLMNEPGVPEEYRDHGPYEYIVQYASLHDCLLLPMQRLRQSDAPPFAYEALFSSAMETHFVRARERVATRLESLTKEQPEEHVRHVRMYGMKVTISWARTADLFARVQECGAGKRV